MAASTRGMLPREVAGTAEHNTCRHCGVAIIRWPNRPAQYRTDKDKQWIHNPDKGFRRRACVVRGSVYAEPMTDSEQFFALTADDLREDLDAVMGYLAELTNVLVDAEAALAYELSREADIVYAARLQQLSIRDRGVNALTTAAIRQGEQFLFWADDRHSEEPQELVSPTPICATCGNAISADCISHSTLAQIISTTLDNFTELGWDADNLNDSQIEFLAEQQRKKFLAEQTHITTWQRGPDFSDGDTITFDPSGTPDAILTITSADVSAEIERENGDLTQVAQLAKPVVTQEDFFADSHRDDTPLLIDLKAMVRRHANAHPRHAQIRLGPSEVGHPCARKIITGLIGVPARENRANSAFDVLPSYIGVAAHKAMEDAAAHDNLRIYQEFVAEHDGDPNAIASYQWPRWLPEREVHAAANLSGTCDLYDTWTDTVIDYKFPGVTRMTMYRKLVAAGKPPNLVYRIQSHLYGKGYINAGYDVKNVGIWFLPRSGTLATSLLWVEPYSEELVQEQLSRLNDEILLMHDLDLENHPERLAMIPITPHECSLCPFFSVNPQRAKDNPFACLGGPEYQPQITNHSGSMVPK